MKGFTLVELLISMFVFSIVSVFSFKTIDMLSQSENLLESQSKKLLELQKFFVFLAKDWNDCNEINMEIADKAGAFVKFSCHNPIIYSFNDESITRIKNSKQDPDSKEVLLVDDIKSLSINPIKEGLMLKGFILKVAHEDFGMAEQIYFSNEGSIPANYSSLSSVDLTTDKPPDSEASQENEMPFFR